MRSTRSGWIRTSIPALVLALVAAGCGGDDDDASSDTASAATSATTVAADTTAASTDEPSSTTAATTETPSTTRDPNAPLDVIKLSGVARANAGNWFVVAGMNAGIMEKYGIEVDIITNPGSLQAITALLSGDGDLAPPTFDAGLQAQLQAPDLKWVAMGYAVTPFELIGNKDITSVEQLQGGTCAVQNLTAVDGLYARLMLTDAAGFVIDEDYSLISMGTTGLAARSAALESGQAQCVAAIPPETKALNDAGYPTLVEALDGPSFENLPFFGYLADSSSYEDDPEQRDRLVRFSAAVMESMVWLYDPANKEEAIEILAREAEMDPSVAESAYEWVEIGGYRPSLQVLPEELDQTVAVSQTVGVLTLFDQDTADFIDMSIADAAFELLDPEMQAKVTELST